MDYRRLKLFSWKKGYDFGDCYSSAFRKLMARRVRKQEKRRTADETTEVRLSDRDRDRFLDALGRDDARPNESLSRAAERYNEDRVPPRSTPNTGDDA